MDVRKAAVAGMFYPADAATLRRDVTAYLAAGPAEDAGPDPLVIVAPHAGYAYSGGIAGTAYATLVGREYDTVILLGPTHRVLFDGVALSGAASWRTPLGDLAIDGELAGMLDSRVFVVRDEAHAGEHSLEVQLPFLQVALAPGFRILPIVFGQANRAMLATVAVALAALEREARKKILVVCSTDLSHDRSYAKAREMDGLVASALAALDPERLAELFGSGQAEACGERGLLAAVDLARQLGRTEARITMAANSGDVLGDPHSRIVGYLAAVV